MRAPFIKMHGLGNDFVILDQRSGPPVPLNGGMVQALCHRTTGIGCDQLIVLEPSSAADLRMRIFNADGDEARACGNAARAVCLLQGCDVSIETAGGLIHARALDDAAAEVDMGRPRFAWDDIPLGYAMDTQPMPITWHDLPGPFAVNVGNPHAVFFVDPPTLDRLGELAPAVQADPVFHEGVNVSFAHVAGPATLNLRVWERGAGATLACGTAACAAAVLALRHKRLVSSPVTVQQPGGDLRIAWTGDTVLMTGAARETFRGTFDTRDFA
ncbi:diaminopimelate epimerase [Erythrobacteraceae bacterium CFH 75059]|uniref:diaminopimelate epimerase n=1 Tax=Qipengyuania thermophila TaxID=2509361 RepID=UPI00102069D2|nr:diaminopimelate epimerase [Qipengyuania thermophila]TCD05520.1 diaminopimelate epimerase [Erythrobacteraceae bacterium CFH 75059]